MNFDFHTARALAWKYLSVKAGELSFGPVEVSLLVIALAMAFVAVAGLWLISQREDRKARLEALFSAARTRAEQPSLRRTTWFSRLGAVVAPTWLIGVTEQERLLTALARAGFRGHGRLSSFIGIKVCCAGAFFVLAWLIVSELFLGGVVVRGAVLIAAIMLGWRLPDITLARLAAHRAAQLENGLPDALDLLVICAEAGLSLGQAIEEIGRDLRTSNRAVSEEFALTAAELRVLSDRAEALENLGRRTGLSTLRGLITTLNQSIRFGTPLSEALGTLAGTMRNERMTRIEERAARLPVLLAIPLMVFILPTLLMIIASPVALRFIDLFNGSGIGLAGG
jgi:tight adherence protein C